MARLRRLVPPCRPGGGTGPETGLGGMIRNRVLFVLVVAAVAAALPCLRRLCAEPARKSAPAAARRGRGRPDAGRDRCSRASSSARPRSCRRRAPCIGAALAASLALLLLLPLAAGMAANRLAATATPIARTSLATGFWVSEFAAALACGDALHRLGATLWAKAAIVILVVAALVLAAMTGAFDQLSLATKAANRHEAFVDAVDRHGFLVVLSVALAPPHRRAARRRGASQARLGAPAYSARSTSSRRSRRSRCSGS